MTIPEVHILALNESKIKLGFPSELTAMIGYQEEQSEPSASGDAVSFYARDSFRFERRINTTIENLELICIGILSQKSKSIFVLGSRSKNT